MIRPFLVDLNPVELKYYPPMIDLEKCSGSCNSVGDLFIELIYKNMCFQLKDVNVRVFDMITSKTEAKTMLKHIHVIVNANSIAQRAIKIKKGMMKHVNLSVEVIVCTKRV